MTTAYQQGLRAMESGRYRTAVAALQTALAERPHDPQVKLWLAMAYEANQQRELARNLCRELTAHPDPQVRQQSQQVLYILEAPQLQRRAEWLNEIPPMTEEPLPGLTLGTPKQITPPPVPEPVMVARSQSNYFVPVTLAGLSLVLAIWAGWG
ncbi:hypothetical protein GlitD10_2260 [Gloeomargarita lithophora Alchichica-D10]|uniref:Tetratricopeptide repeat protein n=1 Tax=Gloeomargarita lithophora Alchichica-D10 TaxID=1188229 RepID=A0A1J0AF94_9CYAN|nr:tetratricopeptide repeat protein [Gloeomargarita lithophora]APB34592.1 hypothetical protein GlitD10_2260 [Gloeomargarita lithophora Alchichica-D10]